MKRAIWVLVAVSLLSLTAFAGPIPPAWSCTGNCGSLGADGVVTAPPSGNSTYLYVSSNGGVSGAGQTNGLGGTNGTLLTTPVFSANAGDPLAFNFNYVTSDGAGFADYAWAKLVDVLNPLNNVLLFTARTTPGGNTVPGFGMPSPAATITPPTTLIIPGGPAWSPLGSYSGACWSTGCGYTGWIGSSYTIASSGIYSLQFGVTNWTDTIYDSGMAIDEITVNGNPVGAVPEPASLVLFGSGLVGLAGVIRRKLAR